MTIYYQDDHVTLHHADCIEAMRAMPDSSVHAIVTDPPYGLGFMGKKWDDLPPGLDFAVEALRVLKPGGHLLAFGGTRTWHRLAVAIEDAGFELRDSIAWLYGSGFPKSLDVSNAIDKAAGALQHEAVAFTVAGRTDKNLPNPQAKGYTPPAPATPEAEQWQGWGTALKPAFEPIVMARKPLVGTVAANVLEHGAGALNIDGCRVGDGEGVVTFDRAPRKEDGSTYDLGTVTGVKPSGQGRWPANVILDEHTAGVLDEQSGVIPPSKRQAHKEFSRDGRSTNFATGARKGDEWGYTDSGGASRFFYVAKAPKSERPVVNGVAHPTVKPLKLMRLLVRLVTPPGGVVLEPFAGSGATVEAALLEGFDVIAIEREAEYLPLIQARIRRTPEATDDTNEQDAFNLEGLAS